MKPLTPLAVLSCFVFVVTPTEAQHCAPIVESYLSQISIKHNEEHQALDLTVEYSKVGGRPMPKYQIYLLAYLAKNDHQVPAPLPAAFIDKRVVRVLHTEGIERNKDGSHDFRLQLNMNELAQKIIELGRLTEEDCEVHGGWGSFKDKFRLAVFVPFLQDSTYSVLDSLPEDKHECNYDDRRALLFQPLPYSFSIHFGTVLAVPWQLEEGNYRIEINQTRPIKERE